MLKRILQLASTLVFVLSGSLVWGQTQGGSGGAVYGMDTIKEVTSIAKLNGDGKNIEPIVTQSDMSGRTCVRPATGKGD